MVASRIRFQSAPGQCEHSLLLAPGLATVPGPQVLTETHLENRWEGEQEGLLPHVVMTHTLMVQNLTPDCVTLVLVEKKKIKEFEKLNCCVLFLLHSLFFIRQTFPEAIYVPDVGRCGLTLHSEDTLIIFNRTEYESRTALPQPQPLRQPVTQKLVRGDPPPGTLPPLSGLRHRRPSSSPGPPCLKYFLSLTVTNSCLR